MKYKNGVIFLSMAVLLTLSTLADARGRGGGGRSSSSSSSHATEGNHYSMPNIVVRPGSSSSSYSGSGTGSSYDQSTSPTVTSTPVVTPEQLKKIQEEQALNEKRIQEYMKQREQETARLKERQAEINELAAQDAARRARLKTQEDMRNNQDPLKDSEYERQKRFSRCQIKPVMTDDDLEVCKTALRE